MDVAPRHRWLARMKQVLRQEDAAGSPVAWMAAQTARTAVPMVRTMSAVEPLEPEQE
jgi:hypothetical protein